MARKYVRKGKTPWPDKDKRMTAAVRKRAEGKNNCQIAGELGVTEGTVRNDLKRWAALNPVNVVPLTRKSDSKSRPAGGNFTSRFYESEDPVPKIRRIK